MDKRTRQRPPKNKDISSLPTRAIRRTRASGEAQVKITKHARLNKPQITNLEIDTALEILRQFDMNMKCGPCVGISRTVRWERARRLGLEPPREVQLILQNKKYQIAIPNIDQDIWWNLLK